jgi:hypothetical protein
MRPPRRRTVEIYFILYLAALVLLMPEFGQPEGLGHSSTHDVRLDLQPERLRLQCRFAIDTAGGIMVTMLDTINTIRYYGDVENLRFTATIEDASSGIRTQVDEASSGLFTLEHDAEHGFVRFLWHPTKLAPADRTLRVTLHAIGFPMQATALSTANTASGLHVSAITQFVLSTSVDDRLAPPDFVRVETRIDTIYASGQGASQNARDASAGMGAFWIEAASPRLFDLAGTRWTNRISMSGADPTRDLKSLPKARLVGAEGRQAPTPSVRFDERARALVVEGITPTSGSMTIEVSAQRRDGEQASTQFVVEAQALQTMQIPAVFHPGIEYILQTRLPTLPGREVSAAIRDGSQWRVQPTSGEVVRFTPTINDTGRTYTFDRYIDKEKVSTDYVRVRPFDPPEIVEIRRLPDSDKRRIAVRFGGKQNRPRLDVIEGNVSVRKLFGDLRRANPSEQPAVSWIEEFEVEPKDGKPPTYRLQAVDGAGARSRVITQAD